MGFMDKAKKLAEQAQQKLDEAQTQFNQNQSQPSQGQQGGVQYDEHGRPIQQAPPPAEVPPATDAPSADAPVAEQHDDEPPPRPPSGDVNASPDPFKPLQ